MFYRSKMGKELTHFLYFMSFCVKVKSPFKQLVGLWFIVEVSTCAMALMRLLIGKDLEGWDMSSPALFPLHELLLHKAGCGGLKNGFPKKSTEPMKMLSKLGKRTLQK